MGLVQIQNNKYAQQGDITFSFSDAERAIFRKRKKIKVSAWATKHRVVTAGPFAGALWDNSITPYSVGIMNASFMPSVREIVIVKGPQSGITQAVNTCLGYIIDRKPGEAMVVYPREKAAADMLKDNIKPMIQNSKRLSDYLTGNPDDLSRLRIDLKHMSIHAGWSSPDSLASKSIQYGIIDEINKFNLTAGPKEASHLNLFRKRQIAFPNTRKLWMLSTPTTENGQISVVFEQETDVKFYFWAICPFCSKSQIMQFGGDDTKFGIKFPAEVRDPKIIRRKKLAWYVCEECEAKWDDGLRNQAVQKGLWKTIEGQSMYNYIRKERPNIIGFHLPAWYSYFVSLSDCASSFLKGLKDKNELKDFMNAIKAEPWKDYSKVREEDKILELKDERPEGLVPPNTAILIGTADTQDNGFYYEIRAWLYGMELESYQLRYGFVDSSEALLKIFFDDEYKNIAGQVYKVQVGFIDSMGHRTSEIIDICLKNRGRLYPVMGVQSQDRPYKIKEWEFFPGTNRPIPGGLKRINANVTYYKNTLSSKLEISSSDPGAWHLHSQTNYDYAKQMCAEFENDKGFWECPKGKANHYWDCGVYQILGADVLGIRFLKKEKEVIKKEKKPSKENPFTQGRSLF